MTALRSTATGLTRPSIRDVARAAGVSPGCVSNVINGRRRDDDPIGRAVMEAVTTLGYRRNTMASNLRRAQSRIIGLIIPDFENPFFAEVVAELERCAEATQYRIVATSSREDPAIEAREIDELTGWRVAGILLIPAGTGKAIALPDDSEAPVVLLDRIGRDGSVDRIGVDNAGACTEAVRDLIARGHRRFVVAYSDDGIDNMAERLDGVRRAIGDAGGVEAAYVPTGNTVETARSALERQLDSGAAPTAMVCLLNTATLAAYGLAQARDIRLGRDMALIGFDDSAWMAHVHPSVAAIAQPVREIAQTAWDRLLARVEGDRAPPGVTRLACRLHQRGTLCGPPD